MKLFIFSALVFSFSAFAAAPSYDCTVTGDDGALIKQVVVKVTNDPVKGMVKIPFKSGYPQRESLVAEFDITTLTGGDMIAGALVKTTEEEEGDLFYRTYSSARFKAGTERISLNISSLTNLDVTLNFDCQKI